MKLGSMLQCTWDDILIWSVGNVTAPYNVSRKDCFPGLSLAMGINLQNFHGNINRYFGEIGQLN